MNDRHATGSLYFQGDYAENAIMQKGFNEKIIADLVQYILRKFRKSPEEKIKPIAILDLCCGDGVATLALYKLLKEHGIVVTRMVGLDVSPKLIALAQQAAAEVSTLSFEVKDINDIDYSNEFDVVISLFGLHWISDLTHIAKKIAQAAKPDGLAMYFVPLEKNGFFVKRQALMWSPKWKAIFNDFTINPFFDSPTPYLTSFGRLFDLDNQDGISGDQPLIFTEERFMMFLSSWMQEVRYLNDHALAQAYLKELIQLIEQSHLADVEVVQDNNEKYYIFHERFFWFHGSKLKEATQERLCEQEEKIIQSKL